MARHQNPTLPKSVMPLPRAPAPVQLSEMVLPIIVTAPVNAIARPHRIFAVLSRLMDKSAIILPANNVLEPRVAELPTSKYTPSVAFPFMIVIFEALAVVSVLPIWKTKFVLDRPAKSRTRVPVN